MLTQSEKEIIANEKNWRSGHIYHLPSVLASDDIDDGFLSLIFDGFLNGVFPFLCDVGDVPYGQRAELVKDLFFMTPENRAYIHGFVAKIEAPIYRKVGAGVYTSSWGFYRGQYVHVDSMDALIKAGEDFDASEIEKANTEVAA